MKLEITHEVKEAVYQLTASSLAQGFEVTATYPYVKEDETISHYVVRLEKKSNSEKIFFPVSNIKGKFELKLPSSKILPLYNLIKIQERSEETIYIVEGEKCVETLRKQNVLATTSGSSSSFAKTDWSPVYGREVILWSDNDEAGK